MRQIGLGLHHASCVAFENRAALILGQSGSGKSALALRLMALGAMLVSDDQSDIQIVDNQVCISAPVELAGLIEARQVGILKADFARHVPLALVVDLDQIERDRLPKHHSITIQQQKFDLIHGKETTCVEYAILQWLKVGRYE